MTPVQTRPGPVLPKMSRLCAVAAAPNLLVAAALIATGHGHGVLSVLAGFLVGLAVYGSLYLFVGKGLEPFVQNLRGRAKPSTGGPTVLFGLMLPLKYFALGLLMWLFWRSGELNLLWFLAGFLITQVAVTIASVLHLAAEPRWR